MVDPNDDRTQNEKDLTMLMLQFIRRLRKLTSQENEPLCVKALDFLNRKKLIRQTDVLR